MLAAQKSICILSYSKRIVASRVREGIYFPYVALKRTSLESCIQLWGSSHRRREDMDQ